MHRMKYLILLPLTLVISGCSWWGETVEITPPKIIEKKIRVVPHPKPVNLSKIKFYVVNENNIGKFEQDITRESISYVFIGMTVKDYENLSLNTAELKRYINQQKEIILYYEKSIKE